MVGTQYHLDFNAAFSIHRARSRSDPYRCEILRLACFDVSAVGLYVCLSVCLSAGISQKQRNLLSAYMLTVAVARSSSDDNACFRFCR